MKKPKVKDTITTTMIYLHRSLKFQSYPFCSLVYTEWIVSIICLCFIFIEGLQKNSLLVQFIPVLSILSIMVILLPDGRSLFYKVGYISIESALISYGATLGGLPPLSMLYIIVMIQSCFLFNPLGRWAIAGLSSLLFLVAQIYNMQSMFHLLQPYQQQVFLAHSVAEAVISVSTLLFIVQLASTLLAQSRMEKQLVSTHQQLQQYALQAAILMSVKNCNRLAHIVYDALGHTLVAQNIQLQTAVKLWQHDPDKAKPFLDQAQQLAVEAIQEIRQSIEAFQTDIREEHTIERIQLSGLSQELDALT